MVLQTGEQGADFHYGSFAWLLGSLLRAMAVRRRFVVVRGCWLRGWAACAMSLSRRAWPRDGSSLRRHRFCRTLFSAVFHFLKLFFVKRITTLYADSQNQVLPTVS
ncbi:hypothetical protein [Bifidobacterium vansinderenii]|uniref:hypothetical protein n=1 Tax=Bifidobacterium vansinderenii TaxID=1984871 RepID=UPI0011775B20|nr:hypothetical protein [Bifidobacterium vansinderenii]